MWENMGPYNSLSHLKTALNNFKADLSVSTVSPNGWSVPSALQGDPGPADARDFSARDDSCTPSCDDGFGLQQVVMGFRGSWIPAAPTSHA